MVQKEIEMVLENEERLDGPTLHDLMVRARWLGKDNVNDISLPGRELTQGQIAYAIRNIQEMTGIKVKFEVQDNDTVMTLE